MPRPRVKICGITRAADARLAVNLGADALGLNFHRPSPRFVASKRIPELVGDLPALVTVVALFVDPAPQEVEAVLDSGLVQCLQFQGNETPEFCASFRVPFIKAVRVVDLESARQALSRFPGRSVILDAYVKGQPGGTGTAFDWSIARELVASGSNPVILAGGLGPDNVSRAIAEVRPYGVDVCSGLESAPGIKDDAKLQRFFEAVDGTSY